MIIIIIIRILIVVVKIVIIIVIVAIIVTIKLNNNKRKVHRRGARLRTSAAASPLASSLPTTGGAAIDKRDHKPLPFDDLVDREIPPPPDSNTASYIMMITTYSWDRKRACEDIPDFDFDVDIQKDLWKTRELAKILRIWFRHRNTERPLKDERACKDIAELYISVEIWKDLWKTGELAKILRICISALSVMTDCQCVTTPTCKVIRKECD